MADDKGPKSSYEVAMERVRFHAAKIAEVEVLHQGRLRATVDPAERAEREQEYRRDRERLTTERDAKIEKARRSAGQ